MSTEDSWGWRVRSHVPAGKDVTGMTGITSLPWALGLAVAAQCIEIMISLPRIKNSDV